MSCRQWCAEAFGLPKNLKLSVHTGSDKFSLYKGMERSSAKRAQGFTQDRSTTCSRRSSVSLTPRRRPDHGQRDIPRAYDRFDEVVGPYVEVIDIDRKKLPSPTRSTAGGSRLVAALRHVQSDRRFDPG